LRKIDRKVRIFKKRREVSVGNYVQMSKKAELSAQSQKE